ncbi:MAG: TonB-dependent receptor [Steroidobacteraceae bacterium]|jgi:iron complex outermembrane receptor protein|nr:TonB-dependent receptor [Steroidobacteraceae bacterium]
MRGTSAFVLTMAALGVATAVTAQESVGSTKEAADVGGRLEEIVVTAQRREENLQKVPVAVTALAADTLENLRVTHMRDLTGLAPNLRIINQGVQSIPMIAMRGIISGVSQNSVDPKIGLYLDGVYVGRSVGAIFDLADIERVEVLRGPQGTLFGRNATGGAISLITAAPTGEFGIKQDVSIGNNEAFRSRTVLNLPAFGSLALKLSYLHDENDGVADNLVGGRTIDLRVRDPRMGVLRYADRLGAKEVDAFQLAARGQVTDALTFDYRFDYTDSKTVAMPTQLLGIVGDTAPLVGGIFAFQPLFGGVTNLSTTRLDSVANASSVQPLTVKGHNLTATWQLNDDVSVKSIAAYREMNQDPNIHDLAGTGGLRFTLPQLFALLGGAPAEIPTLPVGPNDSFFTLLTARQTSQRQFSEELQVTVTKQAFDLVAGAFYFEEYSPGLNVLGVMQPVANGVVIPTPLDGVFGSGVNESIADNRSLAFYSQGAWHATEKLDLTLGLRYTQDDRETKLIQTGASAGGGSLGPGVYKTDFSKTNFTVNLAYTPREGLMTYAKVATGYVAGGQLDAIPYGPEELTNYELGVKSQFLDNRLRTNVAAFYMDYKDIQVQSFQDGVQRFDNAAKAESYGLELEVDALLAERLAVGGAAGYTNFEYQKFILADTDITDAVHPQLAPDWSVRLYGQYDFAPFASGANAYVRLDGRWHSEGEPSILDTGVPAVDRLALTKSHTLVDARVGLREFSVGGFKLGVSLWAQNLLDEDDVVAYAPTVINKIANYIPERTYGIDFTGRW